AVWRRPIALLENQGRPDFPPDRQSVDTAVIHNMIVIWSWHKNGSGGRARGLAECDQSLRQVYRRGMHRACSRNRMVRVRTLRGDRRIHLRFPGLRDKAKKFDELCPERRSTQLGWPASVGTRHRISRVRVVVDREHRKKDVKVCGVLDVSTGWVLCRLCDRLADWRLHLVRIRLRHYVVEIQVHCRLIDAIEVLKVSECN